MKYIYFLALCATSLFASELTHNIRITEDSETIDIFDSKNNTTWTVAKLIQQENAIDKFRYHPRVTDFFTNHPSHRNVTPSNNEIQHSFPYAVDRSLHEWAVKVEHSNVHNINFDIPGIQETANKKRFGFFQYEISSFNNISAHRVFKVVPNTIFFKDNYFDVLYTQAPIRTQQEIANAQRALIQIQEKLNSRRYSLESRSTSPSTNFYGFVLSNLRRFLTKKTFSSLSRKYEDGVLFNAEEIAQLDQTIKNCIVSKIFPTLNNKTNFDADGNLNNAAFRSIRPDLEEVNTYNNQIATIAISALEMHMANIEHEKAIQSTLIAQKK
jgi:hypothetical protein